LLNHDIQGRTNFPTRLQNRADAGAPAAQHELLINVLCDAQTRLYTPRLFCLPHAILTLACCVSDSTGSRARHGAVHALPFLPAAIGGYCSPMSAFVDQTHLFVVVALAALSPTLLWRPSHAPVRGLRG